MIRVDNWEKLTRLLLPIRLRKSKTISILLNGVMLRNIITGMINAYRWCVGLIGELKYTSQVQSMTELLNNKYDNSARRIRIEDGADGEVKLFGPIEPYMVIAGKTNPKVIVVPVAMTNVGCDFTVVIPSSADENEVAITLRKYIFLGVNFKIIKEDIWT